jgi:hypothetical protein
MIFEVAVSFATEFPDLYLRHMNIKATDVFIPSFVFDIKRFCSILSDKRGRRGNGRRGEWRRGVSWSI